MGRKKSKWAESRKQRAKTAQVRARGLLQAMVRQFAARAIYIAVPTNTHNTEHTHTHFSINVRTQILNWQILEINKVTTIALLP